MCLRTNFACSGSAASFTSPLRIMASSRQPSSRFMKGLPIWHTAEQSSTMQGRSMLICSFNSRKSKEDCFLFNAWGNCSIITVHARSVISTPTPGSGLDSVSKCTHARIQLKTGECFLFGISPRLCHPGFCKSRASSASGLRNTRANMFLPYRERVARFVLYQQHSVMRGDRPQRNLSFFRLPGVASIAATSR